MSTAKVNIVSDNKSLPLRVRVFSKWTSNKLRIKGICVTNIINQIKNGVILVNLAEVLTNSSKHKTWTRHPTKSFQFIENIELALCLFKAHGVRFHYQIVTPNEISAGNIKSINSLVWSLIMKYTIEPVVFSKNELDTISKKSSNNASNNHKINDEDNNNIPDKSITSENENSNDDINKSNDSNIQLFKNRKKLALYLLFKWCTSKTNNYPKVTDCKPVHLALTALLHTFRPDVIDYQTLLKKTDRYIANHAIKRMKELKIPILIESDDLLNRIDDRSFFTQIALIKEVLVA